MTETSLLIPCYNAEEFLPALWESVQRQEASFSEIICYDDGSTDQTRKVARSLGMRVIPGERNRGAAHARNRLLEAAGCEWVHFHDADDLLHPMYLSRVGQEFCPDVDVVFCDAEWNDAVTGKLEIEWRYDTATVNSDPVNAFLEKPVGGINGTFRRKKLIEIGGFNEAYQCWEDADLYIRLARAGARFVHIPEVLVTAMRHSKSISANTRICWSSRLQCLKDYATWEDQSSYRATLREQVEHAASGLLYAGDLQSCREALVLCGRLGGDPPTTDSRVLKMCKKLFPPFIPFVLQYLVRRIHATKQSRSRQTGKAPRS